MDVVDAVYPVGSLAEFSIAPQELALNVCVAFARWLETWRMMGFAPLRRAWLERAHGLGEVATVRLVNEEFEGTFKGLSEDGSLLLDQGGEGVKSVSAGEVFFGVGV
jgi:BirA family biotin operon repressor/biotin-[acetyl-CoA-carboxylase] ligase